MLHVELQLLSVELKGVKNSDVEHLVQLVAVPVHAAQLELQL